MSQNLEKISLPPKFFLAGTPMSVRDCAYSDMVTLPYEKHVKYSWSNNLRFLFVFHFLL